jgi:glyoxylate reductase
MGSRARLFATRRLPVDPLEVLGSDVFVASFEADRAPTSEELVDGARGAAAIVTQVTDRIDSALLDRLPGLRGVAQMAVGYDNVDVAACRARGIVVSHTPDALTDSTAELAFGLLLALARRFHEGEQLVRTGSWRGFSPTLLLGRELAGRTLGIVGYGASAARSRCARGPSGCASSPPRDATRRSRPTESPRTRRSRASSQRATSSRCTAPRRRARDTSWAKKSSRRCSRARCS